MLRISRSDSEGAVLLRLEGQLAGPWLRELETACAEAARGGGSVVLDLGDLSLADRAGFELLNRLADSSVTLRGCSPFQEEQLRQIAQRNPS
jgi:hypothetical protein